MGSHKKTSSSKKHYGYSHQKRSPRTLKVEEKPNQNLPALIPESFNLNSLKNIDFVGKIDDMRVLTKELSIMARQLEQWISVAYTVVAAFKDDGIMKEVVKSLATIGSPEAKAQQKPQSKSKRSATPPSPFPFPFFNGQGYNENDEEENENAQTGDGAASGPNIFEIVSNPAFQEIMSKLFLQNKK